MVEKCPICNGTRIVSRRMYETPGVTCSWDTYMYVMGLELFG